MDARAGVPSALVIAKTKTGGALRTAVTVTVSPVNFKLLNWVAKDADNEPKVAVFSAILPLLSTSLVVLIVKLVVATLFRVELISILVPAGMVASVNVPAVKLRFN